MNRKKEIDALIQKGVKKLDANRPPRCAKMIDGVHQCEHDAVYGMHAQALNDECKELGPDFKLKIRRL